MLNMDKGKVLWLDFIHLQKDSCFVCFVEETRHLPIMSKLYCFDQKSKNKARFSHILGIKMNVFEILAWFWSYSFI